FAAMTAMTAVAGPAAAAGLPEPAAVADGPKLLMTMAFVLCLDASLQAFGVELSYPTVAVIFLAGNALGSAAPTPGGIGAVVAASAGVCAVAWWPCQGTP
ncbi:hypothetical protein ACFU6K_28210, partial [Kitasatospora sp. NPDC057512]|uniref:hypothetical protein n=1 Tax=Kitasatospora sp. NPDC057512 TaxID=3346154 RepID=UPI0036778A9B